MLKTAFLDAEFKPFGGELTRTDQVLDEYLAALDKEKPK
jgi:hypothetical protein